MTGGYTDDGWQSGSGTFLWRNWNGIIGILWFVLAMVFVFRGDRVEALLCFVLTNQCFDKQREEPDDE